RHKLKLIIRPTETNDTIFGVKLHNAGDHQLSHPADRVLQVPRLVTNSSLPGFLEQRDSRSRCDPHRSAALRNIVNPRDRLHIPLELQVQLEVVLGQGSRGQSFKPRPRVLNRVNSSSTTSS